MPAEPHDFPHDRARRYLACDCGCLTPQRIYWRGSHLYGRCHACHRSKRFPKRWPFLELAERADSDILVAFYETDLP